MNLTKNLILIFILSYSGAGKVSVSHPSNEADCKRLHEKSFYDRGTQKCVFPIFHDWTCRVNISHGVFGCPLNAVCRYSYCQCKHHFLRNDDSRGCSPTRSYGEACGYHGDLGRCDYNALLECDQGKCTCFGKRVWNARDSKCIHKDCSERLPSQYVIKARSGDCFFRVNLPTDGEKDYWTSKAHLDDIMITCPDNAHYERAGGLQSEDGVKCVCDKGYEPTEDRDCRRQLHVTGPMVNTTLRNLGKGCLKLQHNSFYDTQTQRCQLLVNEPVACSKLQNCPTNSDCINSNECECRDGFVPTVDKRRCILAKSYGETCESSRVSSIPCDESRQLECHNGKCECATTAIWSGDTSTCVSLTCEDRAEEVFTDPMTRECKLPVGTLKWWKRTTFVGQGLSCPENAYFQLQTLPGVDSSRVVGRCTCRRGFQSMHQRSCMTQRTHQESCRLDLDTCNSVGGLKCIHGVCSCKERNSKWSGGFCYSPDDCEERHPNSFLMNDGYLHCVRQVYSNCKALTYLEGEVDMARCPKNAHCIHNNGDDNYSCLCKDGFINSKDNKKCLKLKGHGESCDSNERNHCEFPFSTCGGKDHCECGYHTVWDSTHGECKFGK